MIRDEGNLSSIQDEVGLLQPPSPATIRAAQRQAVSHGRNPAEVREFLAMLTDPRWETA